MYIKKIDIKSFGVLTDRIIEFDEGLNILSGGNECGKSTAVMFIKFMLYGLSGKAVGSDLVSEKQHYVNWETGEASGSMTVFAKGGEYRIDRRLTVSSDPSGKESFRESVKIIDLSSGETVKSAGTPGEYFLGFPEKVFVQSAFVKNVDSARVDGAGLKVALENLMSSGDEEINTKKALEKIDAARKQLLHKNGTGGRIAELAKEKKELEELLLSSQETSKRIVDLEGSLADTESKIAKRESEKNELASICRAYEAMRAGDRAKDIEECGKNIESLGAELESLDSRVTPRLLEKIDQCEKNVRVTEREIEELTDKKAELEKKCEGRDDSEDEDALSVVARAEKYRRYKLFFLSAASSFLVFTLIAVLFSVFPVFRNVLVENGLTGVGIAAAVILALITAAGFFMFSINSKKYEKCLESYGAEDEEELKKAVESKLDGTKYTKKIAEGISKISSIIDSVITKHDEEIDAGFSYGEILGIEGYDNVFDVLEKSREAAADICEKRENITRRLEGEKGRLSAMLENTEYSSDRDEEKADIGLAEGMSREDYQKAIRAKDFAIGAADALREKKFELEKELAALRAANSSPAEIAGRISVLDDEIVGLTSKYKALVKAYETLEKAGDRMRSDIMPRVTRCASEILGRVTDGKYDTLSSGDDLSLSFLRDGEKLTVGFLSEGTKDASYVSLRAALVKVMYGDEMPVMIFDECFARVDGERLKNLFDILSAEGMPQSIVCTCRSEEISSCADAKVISF